MSFEIEEILCKDYDDAWNRVEHFMPETTDKLGSGLYSGVYSVAGSDQVLKKMEQFDQGYITYLRLIQGLGQDGSEYFPRIYRAVIFYYETEFEDWVWDPYKEEHKLVKKKSRNNASALVWMERLKQPGRLRYDGEEVESYNEHPLDPAVQRFVRKIEEKRSQIKRGFHWRVKLRKKHQDLFAMLDLLLELRGNRGLDLHSGNVMLRNGKFVITDPIT